jgi:hypothetical protein
MIGMTVIILFSPLEEAEEEEALPPAAAVEEAARMRFQIILPLRTWGESAMW